MKHCIVLIIVLVIIPIACQLLAIGIINLLLSLLAALVAWSIVGTLAALGWFWVRNRAAIASLWKK